MLPASTMPGDTPHPVSYYSNRTGELKGLPHPTQSYSLYSGAEVNGVSQSGRAPLRNSHFLDPADSPVSPRTHQPDLNASWAHHQRSPLDHRAALEPSIVHRDVSHSSPGILSPDCRQLHSLARSSNTIHPGHAPPPPPLSRERESYEMRPFVPADRMLQHPPALQPPIQAEHQPKSFPPHHQDYNYSQAGTTSPYSRMSGSTPGGEFVRPYPPSFDSRAQHTTTPGYPHHIERRNTAPHQLGVSMYSEPRRESHTPSGSSTTMSPPQDYVRMQSQSSNYISTSDSRHQNYRLHQSPHEVSHNDLIHSPLHNSMGSRQLEFSPRQHSILEPSGMPRVMNQKYTAPSQSTAILATKQVTGEGFEPPSKRVKTEEHGSAGQSTGDVSDQDTEDEDMYEAEDRAGSGTPDPKKRKYSRKSSSRPPMQRNRGTTHISPDIDEDQLPAYVDGVRVNKEWGLTKAGKARQRLPQACIACRKKKIKCIIVKGQIMCEKCKQQNMVCEFKQSTSSRSKGNSAAPESETSHDRSLDDYETPAYTREDAEMSGIAELKREGDNDMHGMDDIPAIEPTKPSTSLRQEEEVPVTQTAVSQPAPMFVPDVMNADLSTASRISEVSQLGNNSRKVHVREMAAQWQGSMPRPRNSSVGSVVAGTPGLGSSPSSPVSTEVYQYTPRLYYSTRSRSTPIASTPTVPSIPGPMGEDTRDHLLPGPKALEHLCTLYFTHLYSQHYPFLHRGTFMANLESHRPVLLFSLCAIAARFSPQYRDKEEEFAVQARQRILDSFDVQWLEVVQAMVLMGLHDFGSNNGHKAWMFAGMAVRLGSALNLNMEPRKEKGQSPIEVEVQRRTYWSYYLMDRLNSYGVARPFLTQDHDCHIQLPCDQDSFENGREVITEHLGGKNPHDPHKGNEHMGAFAYLVRITSIWGDVLKYIHLSGVVPHDAKEEQPEFEPGAEFIKFVNRLKEWKVSLPKSLRYSDENLQAQIKAGTVGTYIMMHVMFHTCAVYVYRYVMTVTMPEKAKEFISQRVPKGYIVNSIRKIFIHADFVMQIMEHVWQRKEEAEKNGDQSVTVLAPFIGQAVSDACLVGIIRASLAPTGVEATEAQRNRVFIAISWLKELKKYWRPIEVMYDKLRKACRNMEKVKKPTKSALPESSSGTGSASVSPKQGLPLDNNFIPSLDSASQQIQLMQQNLVPYQQGSSLQLAYENAAYAGDMLQTMQYPHLSDLIYNVPYLYYVDAINGHGATDQLTGYAMDLDLYPNIFPELASPSTPLGAQPLGPLGMDMTVGLDQQQQQQNPMTTLSSSVLTQSPSLSSSSAHEHNHNPYLDHRRSQNEASSPAQSPAIDSPQQATDSDDDEEEEEEGEDGGDEGEDDNQEEKPEEFGHRYFEPRTTRNRMEIFHCLNSEDVKEEVREAVEAPPKNVLESDDGEADGEKEHCTSGVSNGAFVPGEGESSNSS